MTYYDRAAWGSTFERGGYAISGPVQEVYVHHFNSGIDPPMTVADAMARVRGCQVFHAVTQGWGDIGYSFLVDQLGNVYEGRGWFRTGAHTYGYNSKGYGICWLGDSDVATPSSAALRAYGELVHQGITVGALVPNAQLVGSVDHTVAHRDRNPDTECCGDTMYGQLDEIRSYVTGQHPTTTPQVPVNREDEDVRFTSFRIPNGTIYVEDLQTGSRHELMSIMPAGITPTEAINGLVELINAGLVKGGPNGEAYNGLGWNANWALDVLDDVPEDDRVTP